MFKFDRVPRRWCTLLVFRSMHGWMWPEQSCDVRPSRLTGWMVECQYCIHAAPPPSRDSIQPYATLPRKESDCKRIHKWWLKLVVYLLSALHHGGCHVNLTAVTMHPFHIRGYLACARSPSCSAIYGTVFPFLIARSTRPAVDSLIIDLASGFDQKKMLDGRIHVDRHVSPVLLPTFFYSWDETGRGYRGRRNQGQLSRPCAPYIDLGRSSACSTPHHRRPMVNDDKWVRQSSADQFGQRRSIREFTNARACVLIRVDVGQANNNGRWRHQATAVSSLYRLIPSSSGNGTWSSWSQCLRRHRRFFLGRENPVDSRRKRFLVFGCCWWCIPHTVADGQLKEWSVILFTLITAMTGGRFVVVVRSMTNVHRSTGEQTLAAAAAAVFAN